MVQITKYCLTYHNPEKRDIMLNKFGKLNWHVHMQEGFPAEQSVRSPPPDQLQLAQHEHRWDPHAWSVMQGHMTMWEHFVHQDTAPWAMFMEDDIWIRSDINDQLPKIMSDVVMLNLDCVLLGYLTPDALHMTTCKFPMMNQPFGLHAYPFNVYGTQMYLVRRSHAINMVREYGINSDWHNMVLSKGTTYNADWILTKQGRTACVYPLLAIEQPGEGHAHGDDYQTWFHAQCHVHGVSLSTYL
jgi:hypothetical protein